MPSQTPKQHRAMMAAAHGKSTLGIPKKVGQEFARADANKPAALAKGGRLVDHGDHFKLHTAGGDVMTIAHRGLHPSTVKHLQKFAEGGVVHHYAEGTGDAGSEEGREEEATQDEREAAAANYSDDPEGMAKVTAQMQANQKERDDAAYAEQRMNEQMMPDQPGQEAARPLDAQPTPIDASAVDSADTSTKLPPPEDPVQAAVAPFQQAQLGKFVAAKVHDQSPQEIAANEAAKAARTANAARQDELAGETEKANAEKVKGMQDLEASSNIHMQEIQGRARKLREEIENGKIDPDHYWHEKGTGGRISASIGLLLSGLGSGLGGGPNMAMQVIQANIKRDIDAQEKNLETKKSLLSDTYRETQDLRLSRQMAEHTLMNVALAKLNTIAAKSSSSAVKANAAVANAAGDLALAQGARRIADQRSINQANAANANTSAQNALAMAKAKAASDAGKIPREMQGAKVASMNASVVKLKDHLANLEKGWQGPVAGRIAEMFPWGGADTKANAAAADLLRESIASSFGGGVASDARIKAAVASIPGPEDTPAQARVKIARLEHTLEVMRDEYIAQQRGVGYQIGPTSPVSKPAAPTRKGS